MPLLVHAVGWWLSGLLLPWTGMLLLGAAGLLLMWASGVPRGVLLAVLLAPAGTTAADLARRDHEDCRNRLIDHLQRGTAVWGIVEAAPQRGRLPMTLTADRLGPCRVVAWVRFAGAPPVAGEIVALAGAPRRLERGIRVDAARFINRDGMARLVAWRGRIGARIDRRYGERAPLVRALLIADQRALDPALREQYADAGLVHLLSVSGLHVAIIASALLMIGGMVRVPMSRVEPVALLVIILYVVLLGAPAPAVRSAVMLVITMVSVRWQRPVHAWTALALGAVLPTVIDPLVVTDLGWQLSVAGMAALVGAGALQQRWRRAAQVRGGREGWWRRVWHTIWSLRGWRAHLIGEVVTGTMAVLATAPIVAWHFGRLSLIAPASNLLAGPVVAVLQPMLFLAMCLDPLETIAQFIADASQPLMVLLDGLARWFGELPVAVVHVAPERAVALLAGAAALLLLRATRARQMMPWVCGAIGCVVVAIWWPSASARSRTFEVHILDVGQGDAIALRTPRGYWILIDAGPRWDGGDAARRRIIPRLRRYGGRIALFILTHPHEDHVGGAPTLLRALPPRLWWEAAFVGTSRSYREALGLLAARRIPWRQVRPGDRYRLDGVELEVLAPSPAWVREQENANEASVVIMARYGGHRFLFTGDAEGGAEAWLLAHARSLQADVLKVGHHGSRTSSSVALLDAVRPRVAVVSVGLGNRYGHPAPLTQHRLLVRGVPLLRTDLDGTVVLRSDGRRLTAENAEERWMVPERAR